MRSEIGRWLARMPHVSVDYDNFGNLIALYQRGTAIPRFAFAAHMDHPGFVKEPGANKPALFLGGVPEVYRAKNPPTQDFGNFAMWDLPAFELKEGRIFSRACDDLIGCAAIVAMFEELERTGAEASVYGLFTRAEEVGFVGAMQLAAERRLPQSVTVISLETSSERGGACKMGAGVIVRVGDRTSIFDSATTALFVRWATEAGIPFQRCLMSGGTCEATAYQLYGYRTAALCVALGNYHNCGPEERIECEFVALEDVEAMARLCIAAAKITELCDPHSALRIRLETEMAKFERFF
ncbi:MAG: Peptidase family protein [Chthoniobacteraceae bacterium]|nr:Peptidase family protein [Chthoniobacteraceae bacterium]